jgi:hypothetical protein
MMNDYIYIELIERVFFYNFCFQMPISHLLKQIIESTFIFIIIIFFHLIVEERQEFSR